MEWEIVILWLVTFLFLTLVGAPLTAWLFPHFPDRGIAVALPLTLVIITSIAFWIGNISFGSLALGGGLFGLSVLTLVAILRKQNLGIQWHSYLEISLVFTLAFTFLTTIRAVDPAASPQGGEAFLDMGILQSLLRTTRLPPEDVWYAGKPVRYYYGGHLIAALLSKFTRTPGQYSYNLALAGFYAMLVTATYGVARAIGDARGVPPRITGVFAAFLIGFASNLYTPIGLLLLLLPDDIATQLINLLGVDPSIVPALYPFDIGSPTRVIGETINEFPFYGFLHGDLHAYLTSTPFLILLIALLFAYYGAPATVFHRRWVLLGSTVPVIGLMTIIDTWSFPTACGLLFLTLFFSPTHPLILLPQRAQDITKGAITNGESMSAHIDVGSRFTIAAVLTVIVGVTSLIWMLPFVTETASSRPIRFFPERSLLSEFLLVQGTFLFLFALYFLPPVKSLLPPGETRRLLVLFLLLVGVGLLTNVSVLVLIGPLLVIAALLQWETDDLGYEGILFIAGAGLVLLVEFVYLQDGAAPGRINTVFKMYFQAWIFWGLASGIVLASFVDPLLTGHRSWGDFTLGEKLVPVGIVVLILSLSIYGCLALSTHFTVDSPPARTDDPTLNALAFVKTQHPKEAAAIAWLNQRSGQPTLVSAPGFIVSDPELPRYRWVNAPSSLTGIPTVAGWAHEIGYRDPQRYVTRTVEVGLIYTANPEVQARLLDKHNVEYIYVGPEERRHYNPLPFNHRSGISVAYKDKYVTIYEVDEDNLIDQEKNETSIHESTLVTFETNLTATVENRLYSHRGHPYWRAANPFSPTVPSPENEEELIIKTPSVDILTQNHVTLPVESKNEVVSNEKGDITT